MSKEKEIKMKKIGSPYTKPIIFVSLVCILSIVACVWSNYRLFKISSRN